MADPYTDAHLDQISQYALDRIENLTSKLTAIAYYVHEANFRWWVDTNGQPKERNFGEMMALVHSEISEALEGNRKNLRDSHLPEYASEDVELVDALIRILDILGNRETDVGTILYEKMEYNAKRADHKLSSRAEVNGKAY